ncbi:MAG: EutN/CcmL family microcompartment protein [Pseudomonadota bacterium]
MIRGRVVGQVWGTRQVPGLKGRTLLLVAAEPGDRLLVAMDTLDARIGDHVLVALGSGARNVLQPGPHNRHLLCDAAVAQIVDGSTDQAAPGSP